MTAPKYVAIITDGNGRWAAERGLPAIEGHRAGADVVKERLRDAAELGIEELTVFSFSTENWQRPRAEVDGLMAMFAERIDRETPELDDEGVRMRFVGRREGVAAELVERMEWAEAETAANDGSRSSSPSTTAAGRRSSTRREAFEGESEDEFRSHLYAPEMHDPDLLIRTSGEQRVSNFLLWQCAYSELVFRDELWPDFGRDAFEAALERVREPPAALRGQMTGRRSQPFDAELDFEQPAPSPAGRRRRRCAARRRGGGAATRRAEARALRDARPDRLGAAVDRDRGHDRRRRRRAVRRGDDRLRLRRARRALPDDRATRARSCSSPSRPPRRSSSRPSTATSSR